MIASTWPNVNSSDAAYAVVHATRDRAREIDVATSDGRVTFNEIKRLEDDLGMPIAAATRLQSIVTGSRE